MNRFWNHFIFLFFSTFFQTLFQLELEQFSSAKSHQLLFYFLINERLYYFQCFIQNELYNHNNDFIFSRLFHLFFPSSFGNGNEIVDSLFDLKNCQLFILMAFKLFMFGVKIWTRICKTEQETKLKQREEKFKLNCEKQIQV